MKLHSVWLCHMSKEKLKSKRNDAIILKLPWDAISLVNKTFEIMTIVYLKKYNYGTNILTIRHYKQETSNDTEICYRSAR